ncbi:MAG: prepilin-type N-terminal cleavage/methylation domain-containing protein [Planctomycetota bacterium]
MRTAMRSGFTLIELLVSISIIGLLIGLLLPALASARDSAQKLVCLSNTRQTAIGWQIYANDNDDLSVPAQPGRFADDRDNVYRLGNGLQYRPKWFAVIGAAAGFDAYSQPSDRREDEHTLPVDGSDVFVCPEADTWISSRNFGYGYNYQFLGNTRFRSLDGGDERFVNFPVRASSIDGARTVLSADSLGSAAGKPEALRTDNREDGSRDPGRFAKGGHGYALDPPRIDERSDISDPRSRGILADRSAPDARHRGKANVQFVDGHAESLSLEELGYEIGDAGEVLAGTEIGSNVLFSGSGSSALPAAVSGDR